MSKDTKLILGTLYCMWSSILCLNGNLYSFALGVVHLVVGGVLLFVVPDAENEVKA